MIQILKEIILSILIVFSVFVVGIWFIDPTGKQIMNSWIDNYFTTGSEHVARAQDERIFKNIYGSGTTQEYTWEKNN
ncbi:hypothetical protein M0R36_11145 [bacterium]|jgi:hypothetical protein|nr:hypothetical protein [bacterium]